PRNGASRPASAPNERQKTSNRLPPLTPPLSPRAAKGAPARPKPGPAQTATIGHENGCDHTLRLINQEGNRNVDCSYVAPERVAGRGRSSLATASDGVLGGKHGRLIRSA